MKRPLAFRSLVIGELVLAVACGSEDVLPPGAGLVNVAFVYEASTSIDPAVEAAHPQCVDGVGQTHIHPSWRNFARFDMNVAAVDRWEITLGDVPAGSTQRIRISDPNTCALNSTGASTDNVFANGVHLTNIVDTPGTGIEPGLSFTVDAGGTVTP